MLIRSAVRLATLAALLPLLPSAAFAAGATATQNVNVRSGPATTYGVVTQLHQGDAVDVRQCEGLFCQVTFNGKTGWVSASFLTRDSVPTAPQAPSTNSPLIATAPSALPQPIGKPSTQTANPPAQVASTGQPAPLNARGAAPSALPLGTFPPAYDGPDAASNGDNAIPADPGNDDASAGPDDASNGMVDPNGDGNEASSAEFDNPRSSVTLPDDGNNEVIASAGNPDVPRPKADVPGGLRTGPDDDMADNGSDGNFADAPDEADQPAGDDGDFDAGPTGGWRGASDGGWRGRFGRFGFRGHFVGAPAREACFFGDSAFAGQGFCLREGQHVAQLGDWSDRIFALRNPRGLRVTVCSMAGPGDCRVYDHSGPLFLRGDMGIASITVDPAAY